MSNYNVSQLKNSKSFIELSDFLNYVSGFVSENPKAFLFPACRCSGLEFGVENGRPVIVFHSPHFPELGFCDEYDFNVCSKDFSDNTGNNLLSLVSSFSAQAILSYDEKEYTIPKNVESLKDWPFFWELKVIF